MPKQLFSVKQQVNEIDNRGNIQRNLVCLGDNLSWGDAVALRKENSGSWTHPQNVAFRDATKKVFVPELSIKSTPVKKHRVRVK